VNLDTLSREVGESLTGAPAALCLWRSAWRKFSGAAGMGRLMAYWYHYAIMFEALHSHHHRYRNACYQLRPAGTHGRVRKEFAGAPRCRQPDRNRLRGVRLGYLIYTGSISTIWPVRHR